MTEDDLNDRVDQLARDRYPDNYTDDARYRVPDEDDVTRRPAPPPDEDPQAIRFSLIEIGAPDPAVTAPVPTSDAQRILQLEGRLERLQEHLQAYAGTLDARAPLTTVNRVDDHGVKCGMHPSVIVSMTTQSVRCRVCGAELAPLDVLREYARGERQFNSNIDTMQKMRADLQKEIRELTRVRDNLKAQVRRRKPASG